MSEKVIIIGSGPAGLTAAIYASRANLRPLLFEGFQDGGVPGGQLMITGEVENFPGFPGGIGGPALMANMREQAEKLGARMITEDVLSVDLSARPFAVISSSEERYGAEAVIIATGATANRLPLESEKRLWGRGVSACAVCDGALPIFRNKELAVIGGGDTAVEEAVHLTQFASKVYLIHRRDELRASKVMRSRAESHPKIEILWNKVVDEFLGDDCLNGLKLRDTVTGAVSELTVAGAFEAIGHKPNTGILNGQLETDRQGYIVTTPGASSTAVPGVFAAGDVRDSVYRQAITAAASGCMAAIEAERFLNATT
ncbi:MAG: thioredoxin-disulfide reductase [Chitinispirillia bacterium]|nr:thioredoxin-disulfide reductase [Chitinispirillia bacterium]MCL2267576.1 thioredoxin-disulfide reductase [Chitinispirillia bacterium]